MKSWYQKPELEAAYRPDANSEFAAAANNISVEFCEDPGLSVFFEELELLRGVPTSYLVPDKSLLPPESLRLFYVDQNWVNCLVDGAMSISRNCTLDTHHDAMLYPEVEAAAFERSAFVRSDRFGFDRSNVATSDIRTGFLLRSRIVSGWPGTEVACYEKEQQLPILRHETLGDEVMLCIAGGVVTGITFTEPAESLHFAIEQNGGRLCTQLVSLRDDSLGESLSETVDIPFREGATGVIDITRLANDIDKRLAGCGYAGSFFSSLEMAVEMMSKQSVAKIELTGGWAK